ncbi:MAG: PAS domain S-box protein [Candidatus Thorarchaeota archaeon]
MTTIENISPELYENILNNLDDSLHVINHKFELILINNAMKKWMAELDVKDNLLGLSLFKAFPFLSQNAHDEYNYVLKEGKSLVTTETISISGQNIITETRKIPIIKEEKVVQIITIVRDITLREMNKRKLEQSEEKFKSLFKRGLIPTYAWKRVDNNFILIDYNYAAEKITHGGVKNFLGSKASKMYQNRPDILKELNRCLHEKKDILLEMKYIMEVSKEEKDLLVKYVFSPPDLVLVYTEDITERKMAEHELQESEEKYRTLAEQSFLGIAILQDDRIQYVNKQLANTVGYTVEEILAWEKGGFLNIIYPDYREFITEQARKKQMGESDIVDQYQFRGIKKNGEIIWMEVFSMTINYKGKPADFVTIHDITDEKISEKKLRESEEKFRSLVETTSDWIWEVDKDGIYTYSNPQVKTVLGYEVDEIIGKTPFDLMPLDEAEKLLVLFQKAKDMRVPITNVKNKNFHKNGNLVTLETSGVPFFDKDGTIMGYRGIDRNITEKLEAERKLKESEERYRSLTEGLSQTGIGIDIIDYNHNIIYQNQFLKEQFGEHHNTKCYELYLGRKESCQNCPMVQSIQSKKVEKEIIQGLNNRTYEIIAAPLPYPDGTIERAAEVVINITDRIESEQKIKESEEKYRNLFDSAPFAIVLFNVEGTFLDCNKATNLITGYSKEEMIGKNYRDFNFYVDIRSANLDERHDDVKDGKTPKTREVLLQKKDGSEFWAKINLEFIQMKGNTYIQAIIQDVSEQKQSQINLKESESKFRNIFEAIPDLYFLVSGDTKVIEYRGKEKVLYVSPEEFMGKKVTDVLPPKLGRSIAKLVKRTLITTQPQSLEYELEINGLKHFYESRYFYLSKDKVSIFIRDITERKNIEKQISDLAKFPSENPNPVLRVNREKIIYINKAGQDLFHLTEGGKIPNSLRDVIIKAFDENKMNILEADFGDKSYSFDITPILQEGYVNVYGKDITKRKKSEKALTAEKQFVDDILNASMDTVFVFNPESGKAVRWNDQFKQVSGYSDEEIASIKAPDSYYNEEDLKRAAEAIKNVLEKGTITVEMSLITKDGRSIPYEYSATTLENSSGKTLIVSIGRDMSERRIVEQRIKDSEQKFRDLYEEAPIAYFSIAPDKSILRVNKAAERLLGYNEGDFLKMKVFDLYPDTDYGLKKAKEVFNKFIAGESIKDVELQMINKEGNPIWISLSVKPIFDSNGNVIESRSMVLDINERKIAQEEVKKSYNRLEELEYIINNSPGVVFLWKNLEGWPVEFVSENVDQWGYTPDDFYSRKIAYEEIIYPDDLQRVSEEVEIHSNEDVNNFDQEYRILTKSGEIRWLDDRSWIRRDSNGEITHYQGIVLDITDRKIAEEALRLSEKNYKEAYDRGNFYKDLFAHDINNILQVINSSAELITYQLGESEKSKEIESISDIIKKQVNRGSKLISNVRTLSELEEKEIVTHKVEIGSILRNSITFVEKAYEERKVEISLSPINGKYFTYANELLQDVFENVLINGIKYNENSNVEILIAVSKHKIGKNKYFKLEFVDNGIGVADNRKEVIFMSGNRELKGSKGMGLGLSLVNKILQIFKGKIWVEDKVKGDHTKGSKFVILLPEVK